MIFNFSLDTNSNSSPAASLNFKPIEIPKNIRRLSSVSERPREGLDDYLTKVTGDFKTILEQIRAERYVTFFLSLVY